VTRARSVRERAFLGDGVEVVAPAGVRELAEVLRAAEADGRRVLPAGLGAHTFPAGAPADPVVVSTCALDDVVTYEPDDFTIGVAAGLPLERLRDELAANGQELPADFGAAAAGTVGGLVARAPIGPRAHRSGPLSALLLGAEGLRGGGAPFRAGGMVVKNVAGYQVHKLLVGSGGHAGVIVRANFRLRPLPERREVRFAAGDREDAARAAAALKKSGTEGVAWLLLGEAVTHLREAGAPVPDGEAAVGWLLEGNAARVAWQSNGAGRAVRDAGLEPGPAAGDSDAVAVVHAATALAEPEGAPADEGAVRLAVLPTRTAAVALDAESTIAAAGSMASVLADPFTGVVHVRWNAPGADGVAAALERLVELARRHEGVARLLYVPPGTAPPSPLLTNDPNAALAARILDVFDPKGTFAPAGGVA